MSLESGTLRSGEVRSMFDRIAPVYDAMNRLMTAGLDRRWRRAAVDAAVRPGDRVLDACCGTGDLAIEASARGASAFGLDFSERMLERARRKSADVEWVRGDALALPFDDASFDAATVGFGVRNLEDLPAGLRELRRVLKPGGRLAVLEITRPHGPLRYFFRVWFDGVVPLLGRTLPGGAAYAYLPASVRRFPGPQELAGLVREAGFADVGFRLFAGGIVALHSGIASGDSAEGEGVEVRRVRGEDADGLSRARIAMLSEEPWRHRVLAEEERLTGAEWHERASNAAVGRLTATFVAVDRDGVRGAVDCHRRDDGAVFLGGMWVDPRLRRRGIGRALTAEAIRWVESVGGSRIELWMIDTNEAARALYEGMGFAVTGESAPVEDDPGLRQVRMSLSLSNHSSQGEEWL